MLALVTALAAAAQAVSHAQKAQLSVPFGTVDGSVFTVGEALIFVDTEQPANSFAVAKDQIEGMSLENDVLTVSTKQAVRDRSGERRRFSLKLMEAAEAKKLIAWSKTEVAAVKPVAEEAGAESWIYNAKHQHFPFGECSGRMEFSKRRFTYESVENAGHSRQWTMKDVREVKQSNPYELEVTPFDGNDYKFKLTQRGMTSDEFRKLVEMVTEARMPK